MKPTRIPYWGERNYLHSSQILSLLGTSLHNFGVEHCSSITTKFYSFIQHQCEFILLDELQYDHKDYCAIFTLQQTNGTVTIGIRETDVPILERIPNDETRIIAGADFDTEPNAATIATYPPDRFFAVMVALNKHLILKNYPVSADEAWILAQLDLENPFDSAAAHPAMGCSISKTINRSMVKSILSLDGAPAGSTLFKKITKP